MPLQFRKGPEADLSSGVYANGEPLFCSDTFRLFIHQGGTHKLIGSPRSTEWAQCTNTVAGNVSTITPLALAWDTSGTQVSDTDLYTVAAAGITVATGGYYKVEGQVHCKADANADARPIKVYFTIDGTGEDYFGVNLRYQKDFGTCNWSQVLYVTAGEEVGVEAVKFSGTAADTYIEAGACLLTMTRLQVGA